MPKNKSAMTKRNEAYQQKLGDATTKIEKIIDFEKTEGGIAFKVHGNLIGWIVREPNGYVYHQLGILDVIIKNKLDELNDKPEEEQITG